MQASIRGLITQKEATHAFHTLSNHHLSIARTVSLGFAKEKKHKNAMDPQEMMEVWKKLGQPGEPHKLFASLAGSWTTQRKEWSQVNLRWNLPARLR